MAWIPRPGDEVVVASYGTGRVIRTRGLRAYVYVYAYGLELEVDLDAVSAGPGSTPEVPAEPARPSKRLARRRSDSTARKAFDIAAKRASVEALRFGLVPSSELERLTLGYGPLEQWILSRLPVAGSTPWASEVCGPFGTGKSHTMAAIRHVAQQQGYVTASVEVDGTSMSLSDPERLLHALWTTLASNRALTATPLLDMCIQGAQAGHAAPVIAPRGIDRLHDNYSTARLLLRCNVADTYGDVLDSVLSSSAEYTASEANLLISRDPAVPALAVQVRRVIGQKVVDRPHDFIEAWVGYAELARLAGFKGLVLTVDEFEVEHFLAGQRFERVVALVNVLQRYFRGELQLPQTPLSVFFATVGEQGHVGDVLIDRLVGDATGSVYQLEPLEPEGRHELGHRIAELYCEAYGIEVPEERELILAVERQLVREGGAESVIRLFIKTFMGVLDSQYGPVRNG